MQTLALGNLFNELVTEFRRDAKGARAAKMLEAYAGEHEDWREFAYYEDSRYTRNMLFRNEDFELLLLCWGPGMQSPIHSHMGQNCWMAVLDGDIEEVHFRTPGGGQGGPLEQGRVTTLEQGRVAYISDDIALHLVRPTRASSQGGATLHLYSKPIDSCFLYDEESGEVVLKTMAYHTVQGVRTGA